MDIFQELTSSPSIELPSGSGYSLEWVEDFRGHRISVPNGELLYSRQFFGKRLSDRTAEYLQENDSFDWRKTPWRDISSDDLSRLRFTNINWKQDHIKLYGKLLPLPRLTSWYGDGGKSYSYSGITSNPNQWNAGLLHLKQIVEKAAQIEFNSVLLNWYRDGEDHLSWHADDEKELGRNPVIASVNFGETRDFVIRRNSEPTQKLVLPLGHGTLLIMRGELQHFWQHSVPKRKRVSGSRFNLTFRRIGL